MTFKVMWDNEEKTVIRYETYGRWTTDEFWEAIDIGRDMLREVEHKVHFIIIAMDKLSEGHIPNGFITHINSVYRNPPPNVGVTIAVQGKMSLMTQLLERLVNKMLPQVGQRIRLAESLEEARTILDEKMKQNNHSNDFLA